MDILQALRDIGLPAVTAFGGWFFGRKKRKVDIESSELKNLRATMDIYMTMVTDLKKHIDNLESRVDDLTKEKISLQKELSKSRKRARENENKMRKRITDLEHKLQEAYEKDN